VNIQDKFKRCEDKDSIDVYVTKGGKIRVFRKEIELK